MSPRLKPLGAPPILFAHRGARAHAPENTTEAFRLALRLGATGLESDVWLTADRVAVLDHNGVVGGRMRRRMIGQICRDELPAEVPTVDELFDLCPPGVHVSLDLKEPDALPFVLESANLHRAVDRTWICHPDLDLLLRWRDSTAGAHLVHSTRYARLTRGLERHAADLAAGGIDALNMPVEDWSGGHVTMCHRFDRRAFAWDAQFERQLIEALDMGIDAVYSDHPDRMSDALGQVYG